MAPEVTTVYLAAPSAQEKAFVCLRVHSEPESGSELLVSEDILVHITVPVLRVFAILESVTSGFQVTFPPVMVIVYTVLERS